MLPGVWWYEACGGAVPVNADQMQARTDGCRAIESSNVCQALPPSFLQCFSFAHGDNEIMTAEMCVLGVCVLPVWPCAMPAHQDMTPNRAPSATRTCTCARVELTHARICPRTPSPTCVAWMDAMLRPSLPAALTAAAVQAKDVFEAFYKKDFAKRLLMDKSSSIDMEKSMIAKLKAECGAQYTSKLEGMFKDEQVSKDIAAAFRASEEYERLPRGMDVNMRVLTAGFWPSYPVIDMKLPADIQKCGSLRVLRGRSACYTITPEAIPSCPACSSARAPAFVH